jgi:hypothetical protein
MIKFSLLCGRGHEFESWFQSGEAFEAQSKDGRILCPLCQAVDVTKAIMAPAIASKTKGTQAKPPAQAHSQVEASQAELHADLALLDPHDLESRAMIAAFRKRVFEQAEDVGMHFAEEARKIHDGCAAERLIHGQANFGEARALIEDGIAILPIPPLPDELN